MASATSPSLREEVHRIAEELQEGATWDDVMYQVYVRRKIERGLDDMEAGRTISLEEIKREFGLVP